jgi:3-isopropylmalate dehydratase small subunit
MRIEVTGRLWRLGNNIDTDLLFPGRFMTLGGASKQAALEGLAAVDPELAGISAGDGIVAGTNFGCGSSREYAVTALQELGVRLVVARSFARIFYRNAINLALPVVELDDVDELPDRGPLVVNLRTGVIADPVRERAYTTRPMPDFLIDLMQEGGLMAHLRAKLAGAAVTS